ncbi:MAG TPA: metallopeptidase family protein [Candidatus Acidoferrales bacterium]|nr:metallopeptidase family protein [Candidatus Acidoferrales bacterium]
MKRERFVKLVEEAIEALPEKFARLVKNVAVVVEDEPSRDTAQRLRSEQAAGSGQAASSAQPAESGQASSEHEDAGEEGLLMGEYIGVPLTERGAWEAPPPDKIVLYQKNIEAACESEEEIREEVRLTVLHELGHYFGMDEQQLEDV